MKANTVSLVWKKPFGTADELCELLLSAAQDSNTSLSEIAVDVCSAGDRCGELKAGTAVLEAEALSDASIVYNITLH